VVIYLENVSFDHYFGTYPHAANTSGQRFQPAPGTPTVNGLGNTPGAGGTGTLLTNNPNRDLAGNPANPRRLDPTNLNDVLTCDQDHGYTAEQQAFDGGKMDKFLTSVGTASGTNGPGQPCKASDVMHYYDGNTTTGLWNYAQQYAMSDNSFGTTSPGAINLAAGNTGGVGLAINGAKLRVQTRTPIAALQRRLGTTTVYVTHDQTEALTMGDRVAILKDGVLQQVDTPRMMYDHPVNAFVAGFIGSPQMNLFQGRLDDTTVRVAGQDIAIERTQATAARTEGADTVQIGARPEDLRLGGPQEEGITAEVVLVEELGADAYIYARAGTPDTSTFDIVVRVDGRRPPAAGEG
jgi:hypothetical protein